MTWKVCQLRMVHGTRGTIASSAQVSAVRTPERKACERHAYQRTAKTTAAVTSAPSGRSSIASDAAAAAQAIARRSERPSDCACKMRPVDQRASDTAKMLNDSVSAVDA